MKKNNETGTPPQQKKGKKWLIILAVVVVIVIIASAMGGGDDSSSVNSGSDTTAGSSADSATSETEKKTTEDDGIINFDGDGYNVTYVRHETGTDYEGNPCLYYYYTFTNNGEENTSAAVASYIQCFQNGVQKDTAITTDSNDSINNYMNEVQPGGSVEVCQVFSLDDMSDVTIEASDLISFSDEKDTQTIVLQ